MKPWRVTKSDFPQPWIGHVRYTRLPSEGRFHNARPDGSWAAGRPWRSPHASTFLMVYFCLRRMEPALCIWSWGSIGCWCWDGGGGGGAWWWGWACMWGGGIEGGGAWDEGGRGAWRGSGGLCCLKKANVVAALVSDNRRGGVGRRGGESLAALSPRPIDSLFNFLRCLRRSCEACFRTMIP